MSKNNTRNTGGRVIVIDTNAKMGKKTKYYWTSILVGVALIAVALVVKNKDNSDLAGTDDKDILEQAGLLNGDAQDITKWDGANQQGGDFLEGVLRNSEDPNRGNFKLISELGDIYLRTSRDFSSLVGLQVLVLINGTHDNFELKDIQLRVSEDGFIQAQ